MHTGTVITALDSPHIVLRNRDGHYLLRPMRAGLPFYWGADGEGIPVQFPSYLAAERAKLMHDPLADIVHRTLVGPGDDTRDTQAARNWS